MADAPTTPGPLLAFAEWCLSANFDSRDIGMRARAAIAKAAPPAVSGSPDDLATRQPALADGDKSRDLKTSKPTLPHPVGGWRPIETAILALLSGDRQQVARWTNHRNRSAICWRLTWDHSPLAQSDVFGWQPLPAPPPPSQTGGGS